MNQDQIESGIRTILKVFGAVFIQKGLADGAHVEAIIAGAAMAIGVAWSYLHHSDPAPPVAPVK